MRIAYVCVDPGIPAFGTKGASVHVQEVIRELRKAGHEVRLYATRLGDDVPAGLADLPVQRFAIRTKDAAAREQAQRQASRDITAQLLADGAQFIYERYSLFSTTLADSGLPGILEVNAPLIDEQKTHRVLVNEAAALDAVRAQVRAARATVCVSEQVASWVRATAAPAVGLAAPEASDVLNAPDISERVRVIPNGVNVDRITPQPEEPGTPVVTFVGTLKPWHGTEFLIRAAAHSAKAHAVAQQAERRDAPWTLRIIGDGPERARLETLASELGVDVDFRGAVAPADIPAHLAGSAIGAAPYPAAVGEHYFSPLKVYEYMAAGLPVVATAIGQIPEVLGAAPGSDAAGIVVEGSNPQALADAIDELVADPNRRAAMGHVARQRAVACHSWAEVVRRAFAVAASTEEAAARG